VKLGQLLRRLRALPERQHWGPGEIRGSVVQRRELPMFIDDLCPSYGWLWLCDGAATCTDEPGLVYDMIPGDCFIRSPDQPHRVDRPLQNNYLALAITSPRLQWQSMCACTIINPEPRFVRFGNNPDLHKLFWRWFSGLDTINGIQDTTLSMNLLHELLSFLQPADSDLSPSERKLSLALQQALCAEENRSIPLEYIAEEFSISMDYMRQLFQRGPGCLPKEFQIRRRCEAAADLLLDPQSSIATVAEQLGYPDPFAFSKQFSKVMGLSPRTWRRQNA
jgi:AraC-like DNA-binding protein